MQRESAISQTISCILLFLIVIILICILFPYFLGFLDSFNSTDQLAPPLIQITSVLHTTSSGTTQDASRIFIQNMHPEEYRNRDLMAEFYKNHEKLFAKIYTMHGEDFIPTQHFGVATIGGAGCRGDFFSPGEKMEINLKDGSYSPGDMVELRVYQKSPDNSVLQIRGNLLHPDFRDDYINENFYSEHKGYRIISQHQFRA